MSYSERHEEVLFPAEGAGAKDLKDAATTLHGTYIIPKRYFTNAPNSKVRLKGFGFVHAATGGAQTTAGEHGIYVDGTITNAAKLALSVVSHVAATKVETDLNTTAVADGYSTAPAYPEVTVDQLVQVKVVTQGVGAGDQTVWPYLLIQRLD